MLVGMYISTNDITVAALKAGEAPELIKVSAVNGESTTSTTLKINIDKGFAYIGDAVQPLIKATPDLVVIENFLATENKISEVHQEADEKWWNAAELLALILKKNHQDICVFDDKKIKAVLVSTANCNNQQKKATIADACNLVNLPFVDCIHPSVAACYAYGLSANQQGEILILDWGKEELNLSLLKAGNNSFKIKSEITTSLVSEKKYQDALIVLLSNYVENSTGKAVDSSEENKEVLAQLAEQFEHFFNDKKNNISTAQAFLNERALSITLTKNEFNKALTELNQLLLITIQQFLCSEGLKLEAINDVLITGQSTFFSTIKTIIQQNIDEAQTKIHCTEPETVLAKGTVLYLGQNINQLKAITKEDTSSDKLIAAKEKIKTTLINAGYSL